jgi:hypothetical protein
MLENDFYKCYKCNRVPMRVLKMEQPQSCFKGFSVVRYFVKIQNAERQNTERQNAEL